MQFATHCCNNMNIKSRRKYACAVDKCKILTVQCMCGTEKQLRVTSTSIKNA